jgi:hypothetical protein
MPLRRRSRRFTRARQFQVPLEHIGAHLPRVLSSPPTPLTHEPSQDGACCAFTADRQVSSGGTVFVFRRHTADCPTWSPR